jgi:thymidylate synthase
MPNTSPHVAITVPTLGAAWVAVAARILESGALSAYDGLPILELAHVTLDVAAPNPDDPFIAARGDPERLAWMRANFRDHAQVAALGDADSYATRLYDYARAGRDQVAWVIERLRRDPESRSATITTFQPLTDTSYVPCVSLLDFWLPTGALELVVYAHSIDFGAKGYGNLVELAAIQRHVAAALGVPTGHLVMVVKSAHIYDTDLDEMRELVAPSSN